MHLLPSIDYGQPHNLQVRYRHHCIGVRVGFPLWVSSLLFLWNWISDRVKISCVFPLHCEQELDGYSHMNNNSFLGGQVGLHCGEFSEDGGVSHGELPDLE